MKINILDCTLRDGGYINNWCFGNTAIKSVVSLLTEANINIIECGFLLDKTVNDDETLFNSVSEIRKILPDDHRKSEFVAMASVENYSTDNLERFDGSSISGIRVIFHDYEIKKAIRYCMIVKEKGYKLFFQPMSITTYSDKQLIYLIEQANALEPYAVYIVDTLGLMTQKDVERIFYLFDNNLNQSIAIGFHSHNNLQLSFSNAQKLLGMNTNRTLIIDASIYGMGRGAGNLSTELITQYVNEIFDYSYRVDYLLKIYDKYIRKINEQFKWGYSVEYYLAAVHKCHPNYAKYLLEMGTLPINDVGNVLMTIAHENKHLYNEEYIVSHYLAYQDNWIEDSDAYKELKTLIADTPVLLLAPGKSIFENIEKLQMYVNEKKPFIISVNHKNELIAPDCVFFSNRKRYEEIISDHRISSLPKIIVTSNIKNTYQSDYCFNYAELCSTNGKFIDNASIMLLKLLEKLNTRSVALAGMDGFLPNTDNYYYNNFQNNRNAQTLFELNETLSNAISFYAKTMNILFLTPSVYSKSKKGYKNG